MGAGQSASDQGAGWRPPHKSWRRGAPRTVPKAWGRVLNLRPQAPDPRDWVFGGRPRSAKALQDAGILTTDGSATARGSRTLPASVDIRPVGLPVWDQGQFGTCTAFTTLMAVAVLTWTTSWRDAAFTPSWMYQYNNTRMAEGTPLTRDLGATMRGACAVLNRFRAPPAAAFPYTEENLAREPPLAAYAEAAAAPWVGDSPTDELSSGRVVYEALPDNDLDLLRAALAAGMPVVIGVVVAESFYAGWEDGGNISVPGDPSADTRLGGHALVVVGYDDAAETARCRNSWGTAAGGDGGDLHLPYEYLTSPELSFDWWALSVEGEELPPSGGGGGAA